MKDEMAVLMAAGLGTRMRPLTERIAKPLVTVCGKPLIETVIEALQRRGVTQIYVVVGYLKEQFVYLKEKYTGLELIDNKEYLEKNNISSLYAVGELLGSRDCFICEADLYVTDNTVFQKEFEKSCYFGKKFEGYSSDWIFEMQEERIVRVVKGGTDTYNMAGVSYWKKEDARLIKESIADMYQMPEHKQMFWDEIVDMELKRKRLDIRVEEIPSESIIEIDTLEELCKVDECYSA